jgi:hypothetical protein
MSHVKATLADVRAIAAVNFKSANPMPLGLIGPVGIAKTQFLKNDFRAMYAEHLGLSVDQVGLVHERVANRDSAEIAGVALPTKDADGNLITKFTKAPMVTAIEETRKEYGIVLIDEMFQSAADVQKVLADLLDPEERTLGGWPIPDGWIVCFTGNRVQDKSGATRLLSHLNNRVLILELEFDVNGWAKWAEANDVNPLAIDCALTYHNEGFFDQAVPTEDGAFCTPRSLVRAADQLTAFMDSGDFDGVTIPRFMQVLLGGVIGERAAGMLCRHIAMADQVPTGPEIHADPEGANVPDSTGYQLLAANRAINSAETASTGEAALQYITRLRPDLQVSLGSKLLRLSAKRGWVLTSSTATAFIAKFHELLPLAEATGMEV